MPMHLRETGILSQIGGHNALAPNCTRRNFGQRRVAEKLVQIALLGASAIVSLMNVH